MLDFFGKSDPYFVLNRVREDGTYVRVFESGVQKNTLNPVWPPVTISLQKLCNGDMHRPLVLICYDYDNDGSHDLIGECKDFDANDLSAVNFQMALINGK